MTHQGHRLNARRPRHFAVAATSISLLLLLLCSGVHAQVPSVSLPPSTNVLLGASFSLASSFSNTASSGIGFGPVIDFTYPPGITFNGASLLGLTCDVSAPIVFAGSCVPHPYYNTDVVCGNAGDTFVSIKLPFGSFTPQMLAQVTDMAFSLSPLVAVGVPLNIYYRAAFQFGASATDKPCCHPILGNSSPIATGWSLAQVVPTLIECTTQWSGGVVPMHPTGLNYLADYVVTCSIAPGIGTLHSLTIYETLPADVIYHGGATFSPTGTGAPSLSSTAVVDVPATAGSDRVAVTWTNPSTVGGTFTLTVPAYAGRYQASGAPFINPISGASVQRTSLAGAMYSWNSPNPIVRRNLISTLTACACRSSASLPIWHCSRTRALALSYICLD